MTTIQLFNTVDNLPMTGKFYGPEGVCVDLGKCSLVARFRIRETRKVQFLPLMRTVSVREKLFVKTAKNNYAILNRDLEVNSGVGYSMEVFSGDGDTADGFCGDKVAFKNELAAIFLESKQTPDLVEAVDISGIKGEFDLTEKEV